MTWVLLSFGSAVLLGGYEIAKKLALRSFSPLHALFWSAVVNALLMLPEWIIWAPPLPLHGHLWVLLKSLVVSCSWACSFAAMKHLPISVITPMRAFSPMFTALGGILLLGEWLSLRQWLGLLICAGGFVGLARQSDREGITWSTNRWISLYAVSLAFGVCAALTDKTIMTLPDLPGTPLERARLMQIWFSLYTPLFLLPLYLLANRPPTPNASTPEVPEPHASNRAEVLYLPLISLALLAADRCYFTALGDPEAQVSVVSCVRQSCIVVSALGGGWLLGEANLRRKATPVLLIIAGLGCLLVR